MQTLPSSLMVAIANYFAKKYHDGTGSFKDGEKESAIDLIRKECKALDFGWEVVPGLVVIHNSKEGFFGSTVITKRLVLL